MTVLQNDLLAKHIFPPKKTETRLSAQKVLAPYLRARIATVHVPSPARGARHVGPDLSDPAANPT